MTVEQMLTELIDREAIRDCIYRYCRGIDRADEASLRSAYWPDASDDHGPYRGPVEGFFKWALEILKTRPRNIHPVSNILIEFTSGTRAVVESYFSALQRKPAGADAIRQKHIVGRFCDVFEKRGREWRIAKRVVVFDWIQEQTVAMESEETRFGELRPIGQPYPHDTIYQILSVATGATE